MLKTFNSVFSPRYPALLTWILWHRLLHPGAHPLFQRTLNISDMNLTTPYLVWIVPLICCGISILPIQLNSPMTILLSMVFILFSSSLYVIGWIIDISVAIGREHERRTYELLCLPPSGSMGVNWAICTAGLNRSDALGWINLAHKLVSGLFLFILLLALMTIASRPDVFELFQFLGLVLDIVALAAAAYCDHVQSIVLGSLIGMLVPTYSRYGFNLRIWPVGVFLTLKAVAFLAALFTRQTLIPGLYEMFQLTGWFAEISPPLLTLAVFYLMHEGFITTLWRTLAYRLNADPADFSFWT
jgi:hypothetical protein